MPIRILLLFTFAIPAFAGISRPPAHPVVLIVHGAWGGAWQFARIDPLLRADGYDVRRATLTGLGERVHLATEAIGLSTHIEDIVNLILFEDLHDIILLGHSYGGMVISGVADRVPERIAHLVYLDALLPNDGDSAFDLMGSRQEFMTARARDGFIAPWWVRPGKPLPSDVPHPVKTFTDHLALTNPNAANIPGVYILTVEPGQAAETDDFFPSAQRARERGWSVLTMEGDHNPHWRQPAETVTVLEEAFGLD